MAFKENKTGEHTPSNRVLVEEVPLIDTYQVQVNNSLPLPMVTFQAHLMLLPHNQIFSQIQFPRLIVSYPMMMLKM